MNTQTKLSDLDLPQVQIESTPLSTVGGKKLVVKSIEFKELGQYDGVVLTLLESVEVDGTKWDKVHSSSFRVTEKLKSDIVTDALVNGPLEMTVISGRTGKGTWYDVE